MGNEQRRARRPVRCGHRPGHVVHLTRPEGSSTVELALLLPLLLIVLVLIAEVAVVARAQIEVTGAAREGARAAATTPDPAAAVAAVRDALGSRAGAARISVRRPHVVGAAATVRIELPHRIAVPLLGGFTLTLRAGAVMRVEQ
jgi:Flp pilus assembly protein TadG